jgi:hypothetical protein
VIKVGRPNVAGQVDYRTAQSDLGATDQQAFLIAANALAWRLAALMLPTAALVDVVVLLTGLAGASTAAVVLGVAVLGPLVGVFLVTFPVGFIAGVQPYYRGSAEARTRFGATSLVYPYYGWRYAFRGRTRPWGALSLEEKRLSNPRRAEAWWTAEDDR